MPLSLLPYLSDRNDAYSSMVSAGVSVARAGPLIPEDFVGEGKFGDVKAFMLLPSDPASITTHYLGRHELPTLQRALARRVETLILNAFLVGPDCTRADEIRIESCKGRLTSRWLHPSPLHHPLSDLDFQLVFRLRLGLPPLDSLPALCPLCNRDVSVNPWHALGCQSLKRRSITIRHDRAMLLLVKYARSLGILASLVPKDLHSLVPDGELFLTRESILVDLSGTRSLLLSWLQLAPSLLSRDGKFPKQPNISTTVFF